MTLIEFLLARIADDERHASNSAPVDGRWDHERISAECDAKRRIIDFLAVEAGYGWEGPHRLSELEFGDTATAVVRHMSLPYRRHVDLDTMWTS